MAAIAQTWSPVTTALVHLNTSETSVPLRTAPLTTCVVTVVHVTALDCAVAHPVTQVVYVSRFLNRI